MKSAEERDRVPDPVRSLELDLFTTPEPINRMRDSFGWPPGQGYLPVKRWSSPKAEFFLFGGNPQGSDDPGETFVVKAGTNWSPRDPEIVFEELLRLAKVVAGLDVKVPTPLGWLADPPLVAMEAVAGDPLIKKVIPDRSHEAWRHGREGVLDLVRKCAHVLAAYHAAQPAPDEPSVAAAIRTDLRQAAKRGLVAPGLAAGRAEELISARGFRFSANDFLVAGDRLTVIDPPHLVRFDVVQRDLSAFTFEVDRALRRSGLKDEGLALSDSIRSAFVTAYAERSPGRPQRDVDTWALHFYELSRIGGMIYHQTRGGKPGVAASALSQALRSRARLGWRGGRTPT